MWQTPLPPKSGSGDRNLDRETGTYGLDGDRHAAIGRGRLGEEQSVNRSTFESREGEGRGPAVRRASTQRSPRSIPVARAPMRGAGGPHTFDGVLPGSENRAARDRAPAWHREHADLLSAAVPFHGLGACAPASRTALVQHFDVRRGAPATSSRSVHRLSDNHIAPAREAVAKEER